MKIFDSFWNPSFYRNNEKKLSFWSGFGRVLIINFIFSIVYATVFYVYVGKNIPTYVTSFSNTIKNEYPSNLVLSIKDGVLVKNIKGELKLYPMSTFFKDDIDKIQNSPKYFFVIDDSKEASLSAFTASEAVVFLGKDGWIAKGDNAGKINSYKELQGVGNTISFSTSTIEYVINAINPYVNKVAPTISIGIILLYTLFVTIGYLFFVLFVGLVIMLLSTTIFKKKFDYPTSYIYSLYALPSVLIIEKLLELTPYISKVIAYIPFFSILLIVLFLWYMLKEEKES